VSGLRVVENFLDMAHFPFVHTDYLGKVPRTEVAEYKVRIEPGTDEIWATDCRFWQPKSSSAHTAGSEVLYKYRVMQPFSAMLYKSSHREGELDAIGLFVQPVDEDHVIAHTLLAYFDDTSTDAQLIAFQHTIFGQDKPILENHALRRMPLESRLETPTRADAMSVAYRRWLRTRGMRFGVHVA
jgi:phenylpropionate dioxygenase-like ring-hydroxylating dioxygenase large terminal subunit